MTSSTREVEEGFNIEEQDLEIRGGSTNSYRLVLPEDGHEWRKYGQKFIKNIAKYRSYFRCLESQCKAKKQVEWLTLEPDNLRVIYDGAHIHAPLAQSVQLDISHGKVIEEGFIEEQDMEIRGGNTRLMLPEDGYEWRKYGQKFIKNIAKYRSYFRCRKSQCKAKKRAEWLTSEPGNLRVVYDGVHSHAPLTQPDLISQETSSNTSRANPYDLLTQVIAPMGSNDTMTPLQRKD